MYEESRHLFESKVYELMNGTTYERYKKYEKNIVEYKDVKTAKALGLYDLSPDCRKIYKKLLVDIETMKDPEGKEVDYQKKINELLLTRRNFLMKEIDDLFIEPPEKSLMDAHEYVIKLANIYMELYRAWVFVVEKFNNLEKINVRRKQLPAEIVKKVAQYMPEHLFRLQYEIGQ